MSRSRGRPLRRPRTRSAAKPTIRAYVEGLRTEEQYVNDWYRRHRANVVVTIDDFRGGPLQLVQHAVEAQRRAKRDERKARGKGYDQYWCVFDVDEHPNLAQAVDLARRHGIRLAISSPCLELWFILHFESQTAWIERGRAQSRSKELLDCSKSLTEPALGVLAERYADARDRAKALDVKHEGDGSPPRSNPSSGVWRLIDSISR